MQPGLSALSEVQQVLQSIISGIEQHHEEISKRRTEIKYWR
jgi:hypothetical protein